MEDVAVGLDGFDRTVAASVDVGVSAEHVRALLADLSVLPDWLTLHGAWRGPVPGAASVGLSFTEQVKLMGIPADVEWTVTVVDRAGIAMTGTGPMGLTLGLRFTVMSLSDGARVRMDAGLGGDPVRGPMGASVVRNAQDALTESVANLAAHAAKPRDRGRAGVTSVPHHASGRMLDPRTPVIVGVGQLVQREPDGALRDPATLAAEALRRAGQDSGAGEQLLPAADAVYAVTSTSWTYRDQAAVVAEQLGVTPRETVVSARFGGDAGQVLINAAGQAIVDGDASVVLVCGAEAGSTLAAAQRRGVTPPWPEQGPEVRPTRVLGNDRAANSVAEAAAGLNIPVYVYALLESAVRAKVGAAVSRHQATITELWSGMSRVAVGNEYAWLPREFTATELGAVTEDNRMVATPYPKLLCANLQVDLAAGLIVCSVAAAEAAGVPQDRWVFLHAGAAAHDEWFVSERGDLAASPAIRTIGAAALAHAGVGIDDIAHIDLYSCFPAAVQIAAHELGLPVGDPDRPLSITGGLTFGGGPGNNYGTHAVATLVDRLRKDPTAYGLSTSLGWYVTKHALGVYSAQPPARPYRALHPVVELTPSRPVRTDHTGPAIVEAYTVQYGRNGAPEAAIVSALTPEGVRVLLRTRQPDFVAEAVAADPLGWRIDVRAADMLAVLDRTRTALPAPPPMPVLVERRGPVIVITLNRPHRRNAVDLATAQLLERVVDAFEADPTAQVAVLTGAGGSFCSGMDLKAAATGQFPLTERRGPLGLTARPPVKPLIAAVEGHALAGGFELALAADLVVASTESEFGIPESKRGLVAAAGGVLRLAQRLPRAIALELALTGEPMSARRLAELGLVNRLAEPGKVLDAAVKLAESIAANAPLSVRVSKQIVDTCPDWRTDEEFERQTDLAGEALFSADAAEGVRAFVERRQPVWTGR